MTHAKLSEMTEDTIIDPSKLGLKIAAEHVDICYPPIFQSGGEYDLKYSAESAGTKLHYASPPAVVHMSVGARYTQYCSNVGRTYMVDPTSAARGDASRRRRSPRKRRASPPWSTVRRVRPSTRPSRRRSRAPRASTGPCWRPSSPKNVGTAMGLEFRDMTFVLNGKCENKIKSGMVFNLAVGLQGLKEPSAKEGSKSETYAIMIADSVLVGAAAALRRLDDEPEGCQGNLIRDERRR